MLREGTDRNAVPCLQLLQTVRLLLFSRPGVPARKAYRRSVHHNRSSTDCCSQGPTQHRGNGYERRYGP